MALEASEFAQLKNDF